MELNKKELKKIMFSFSAISSRIMRVKFDEYSMILGKFIAFIENTDIIKDYILTGEDKNFNAKEDWEKVTNNDGFGENCVFDFGPTIENESYQIYQVLKYILENIREPYLSFYSIYKHKKWQDNVEDFNDRIVLVFINNIDEYLTKVGIDMGIDENITWNVSGGQVNIANDNATVNAIQNNCENTNEILEVIEAIKKNVTVLPKEDAETVLDSIDMIQDEIMKAEPKGKIISNGIKLLAPIISIANGYPVLVANLNKFVEIVSSYIH